MVAALLCGSAISAHAQEGGPASTANEGEDEVDPAEVGATDLDVGGQTDGAGIAPDETLGPNKNDLEETRKWLATVPATPFFPLWSPALCATALAAALVALLLLLVQARDEVEYLAYRRCRSRSADPPVPRRARGVLDRWSWVLAGLRSKRRTIDAEVLEQIQFGRYEWAEPWLTGLRATATLAGLLFTFLGLALTLTELGATLTLDSSAEIDQAFIEDAIKGVRESLPGLGTAFASSIFGVLIAISIGLVDAALSMWRVRLMARTSLLSAEWLFPHYIQPSGEEAVIGILEQQRESFATGLADLGAELRTLHEEADGRVGEVLEAALESQNRAVEVAESNGDSLSRLEALAEALENMPAAAAEVWKVVLAAQRDQHLDVMGAVRITMKEAGGELGSAVGQAREAVSEELAAMREQAAEGTRALATAMSLVRTDGEAALALLSKTSAALEANASHFAEVTSAAAASLEVGATHVTALRESADRFREALIRVEHIAEDRAADEARRLEAMDLTFQQANEMRDAVTLCAGAAERAADGLQAVLGGAQMARYLKELPQLVELAQGERQSRQALNQAISTFQRVAESIETLDTHTERIGQTSELLRGAHERLTTSMTSLADDQMLPAVERVLRTTATVVTEEREKAWVHRYTAILALHEQTLSELQGSVDKLERSQTAVLTWLQKSVWARMFRRGDER